MAFPATGGQTEQQADALKSARDIAATVKAQAIDLRDQSAAGEVAMRALAVLMTDLTVAQQDLERLKDVPGIGQYAKDQYADQDFNIVAEANAMIAQIEATAQWIADNLPRETTGNRWLNSEEIINRTLVDRMLTSGQTAPLRTQLDLLIATID